MVGIRMFLCLDQEPLLQQIKVIHTLLHLDCWYLGWIAETFNMCCCKLHPRYKLNVCYNCSTASVEFVQQCLACTVSLVMLNHLKCLYKCCLIRNSMDLYAGYLDALLPNDSSYPNSCVMTVQLKICIPDRDLYLHLNNLYKHLWNGQNVVSSQNLSLKLKVELPSWKLKNY